MPRVIVTEGALRGLRRCHGFLKAKAPQAAKRAAQVIERHFLLLETTPEMGRPFAELPELRELFIGFGETGYIALYRHDETDNVVYVLAFRHQREAGY